MGKVGVNISIERPGALGGQATDEILLGLEKPAITPAPHASSIVVVHGGCEPYILLV